MKNIHFPIIILICLLVFTSCGDKKSDKPFLKIIPEDIFIQTYTGEKIVFTIHVLSDYKLTNLVITKKHPGEQESTVLDSAINLMNLNYEWAFRSPNDIEEDLEIFFKVTNEKGYQTVTKRILVFQGKKLEETTGLKIYSGNSGLPSAFNLVTLQPMALSADSALRDIQEYQADTSFTNLSHKWVSPSGCRFVKLNGFDYANASGASAKAGYQIGTVLTEIANIAIGDVYIIKVVRLPVETYAVVKINNIIDNEGRSNDFYEFSVKK
jgi:hypothetical protein